MKKFWTSLSGILFIGLVIRILFAFSYDTGDTGAFCHASELLLQGKPVYSDPQVYFSGPPFALHLTGFSHWLGNVLHLPCSGMWKMPTVLADIGIGYLIYLIARKDLKKSKEQAKYLVMAYTYNPVAIFISGFHGQQDPFWLFFVLLSWYIIKHTNNVRLAAVCYVIAFAYKLPAVLFFVPLVFLIKTWKQRLLFSMIIGVLFVLSLLPELITTTHDLIRQSFLYSSSPGIWGISGIVHKFTTDSHVMKPVSLILDLCLAGSLLIIYYWFIKRRKVSFFQLGTLIVAAFYCFTPGFGSQYLLWILPFLILSENSLTKLYSVLVTIVFLHTYGIQFPPITNIITFLEYTVYFKIPMLYPFDLYYPIWVLMFFVLFRREFIVTKFGKTLRIKWIKSRVVKRIRSFP